MSIVTRSLKTASTFLIHRKPIVFPSDTLYGIFANALDKSLVERVYQIKKRNPEKPYIILIRRIEDLNIFNVKISLLEEKILKLRGVSVLLKLKNPEKFKYLHRGTGKLAFRIPDDSLTLKLLEISKIPVIAPSANLEGKPPARSVDEAYRYFLEQIPLYFDWGFKKDTTPSSLIEVKDGKVLFLRRGRKEKQIENLSTDDTLSRG